MFLEGWATDLFLRTLSSLYSPVRLDRIQRIRILPMGGPTD